MGGDCSASLSLLYAARALSGTWLRDQVAGQSFFVNAARGATMCAYLFT